MGIIICICTSYKERHVRLAMVSAETSQMRRKRRPMLLEVMTASDTNVCSAASAVPSAVGVGEIWLDLMVDGC